METAKGIGIGARIRFIRKRLSLTQNEFAKRLCVTNAHISALEKGKEPSKMFIKLMALEFNLNHEWLITGKGEIQTEDNIRKAVWYETNRGSD